MRALARDEECLCFAYKAVVAMGISVRAARKVIIKFQLNPLSLSLSPYARCENSLCARIYARAAAMGDIFLFLSCACARKLIIARDSCTKSRGKSRRSYNGTAKSRQFAGSVASGENP